MTALPALRSDDGLPGGSNVFREVAALILVAVGTGVSWLTLFVKRGSAGVFFWAVELFTAEAMGAMAGVSGISGAPLVFLVVRGDVTGTGSDFFCGGDTGSTSTKL